MSGGYRVTLFDPFGGNPLVLDEVASLTWARTVNSVGALALTLPLRYPLARFARDGRLLVERQAVAGGAWRVVGETIWFVRRAVRATGATGERTLQVTAFDALHLLGRRIVAYAAGSAQASKGGAADDLIKAVVRENLGGLATDAGRDLSGYLTVAPDVGAGASVEKAFSRRNVLTVCQELAAASAEGGRYVAFDVVADGPDALTFRTYAGQRGADHRWPGGSPPVLLSPEAGTLEMVTTVFDATDEVTFVYVGGQGEGEARAVATATDGARAAASPFNRIEAFRDARNTEDEGALQDEAAARLREGRPRRLFEAAVVETAGLRFGVDFGFGDFVTAQHERERLDCRIETVRVAVVGGEERVEVRLRSEEPV